MQGGKVTSMQGGEPRVH